MVPPKVVVGQLSRHWAAVCLKCFRRTGFEDVDDDDVDDVDDDVDDEDDEV